MVQRRSNLAPNPVSPNTKSAGNTNIKKETDYNTKRKDYKSDTNKISIKTYPFNFTTKAENSVVHNITDLPQS